MRGLVRAHGLHVLIILSAVGAALEVALRGDSAQAPQIDPWLAAPMVAATAATLLSRHRFPFAGPAAFWVVAVAGSFVDGRLITYPASLFAAGLASAFLFGSLRDSTRGRHGLLVVVVGMFIVIDNSPDRTAGDLVFLPALFALAWLAGFYFRERGAQAAAADRRAHMAERERDAAARIAAAEERARIARELHDIVAHTVSVMVLQVGAVRHKLPDSLEQDKQALAGVEQTGRTALAEMRRLLGAMREPGAGAEREPQPGLEALGPLAERVRLAGLPVSVHVEGDPVPLPRALDLSAYRIVQEGLTNVLKHADADHADVVVRYGAEELCLEVRDDGRGPAGGGSPGHGLMGIRERVRLFDGELTAGAVDGSGFALTASLRLTEAAR